MLELTVDGIQVKVAEGATLLTAARAAGCEVPTLCHHDGLQPWASCFLCQVEIVGSDRFFPACATPATAGMEVLTNTAGLVKARTQALELLLSDHCGECEAPCRTACPAGLDIAGMTRAIAQGRMDEARMLAEERLVLPRAIGRICPRYCEGPCRRKLLDQPLMIGRLHSDLGPGPLPERGDAGGRVAVVGAGPAGLAAAYHLARAGVDVTIFEASNKPGGGLRKRISGEMLAEEIAHILAMGCTLKCNHEVGKEIMLADLQRAWDGVLVTTGSATDALADACGQADKFTGLTPSTGLFVAGEALRKTGRAAVKAVASGRQVALCMLNYLQGNTPLAPPRQVRVTLGRISPEEQEVLLLGHQARPTDEASNWDPVREAAACLQCGCKAETDCRLRQLATEHQALPRRYKGKRRPLEVSQSHPEVDFEPGKCIQCGICVRLTNPDDNHAGLVMVNRGFSLRVTAPFAASLQDCLQEKAIACARACPTGALMVTRDQ